MSICPLTDAYQSFQIKVRYKSILFTFLSFFFENILNTHRVSIQSFLNLQTNTTTTLVNSIEGM